MIIKIFSTIFYNQHTLYKYLIITTGVSSPDGDPFPLCSHGSYSPVRYIKVIIGMYVSEYNTVASKMYKMKLYS